MIMMFVFEVALLLMKDELSFAIMVNGAQYVMTFGTPQMPLSFVDNWDILIKVKHIHTNDITDIIYITIVQ